MARAQKARVKTLERIVSKWIRQSEINQK
jgi:hypothetical protein